MSDDTKTTRTPPPSSHNNKGEVDWVEVGTAGSAAPTQQQVKKEEKEVDNSPRTNSETSSSSPLSVPLETESTDETFATAQVIRKLTQCKEQGNAFFQAKQYQDASDAYQKGLLELLREGDSSLPSTSSASPSLAAGTAVAASLQSLEAALRANRAMALLKLHDYEQAERETNQSLELDPNNLKVWYRRALAREGRAMALLNGSTNPDHSNKNTVRAMMLLEQAQADVQFCLTSLDQSDIDSNSKGSHALTKKDAAEQQSMKSASRIVQKRVQERLTTWKQSTQEPPEKGAKTTASSSTPPPQLELVVNGGDRSLGQDSVEVINTRITLLPSTPQLLLDRPPPEQQRRDVLRLLMGRQAAVTKQKPFLYAMEGEAFCLLEWSWWCSWCHHVNFFYNQQPQQGKLVLSLLPPGASFARKANKAPRNGESDDDTDTDDDDDDDQLSFSFGRVPRLIDNSKLLLLMPPSTKQSQHQRQPPLDFYQHWYLHSLDGINTTTNGDNSRTDTTTATSHQQSRQLWLRPNLVRGYHYELLPREVYSALRDWYGEVSPSICRRASVVTIDESTANNSSNNSNQPKVVIDLYPERTQRHRHHDSSLHHDSDQLELPSPPAHSSSLYNCAGCRAPYARSRCKQCQYVYYCDRTCQESHWPFHRLECKRWAAEASAGDPLRSLSFVPPGGGGRVGLNNLGNTCFMNSALQCLSHATPLTRHFLSNRYQLDLNAANPLGTGGKLALAYASVLRDLWMMGSGGIGNNSKARAITSSHQSTSPTALKRAIAAFAPRFAGCSQHDAQEFLAYLLDGLHEDLNRIRKAPYVEMPDVSKEANMAVAGARVWDAHQRRNDSLVLDTFYGQFQSTCVCPTCHQVSVSFDAFNHISLEIPQPNQNLLLRRIIPILLFRAPKGNKDDSDGERTRVASRIPQRYGVMVLRHGTTVADVKLALSDLCGIPPDRLAICEVFDHCIYDIFQDNKTVQTIRANDVLAAYEIDPYTNTTIHVVGNQTRVIKNYVHDDNAMIQPQDGDTAVQLPPSSTEETTRQLFAFPLLTSFNFKLSCHEVWEHIWDHVRHCIVDHESDSSPPQQTEMEERLKDALQIRLTESNGKPLDIFKRERALLSSNELASDQPVQDENDDDDEYHPYSLLPRFLNEPLAKFLGPDCTEQFLYMSLEWSDINADDEELPQNDSSSDVLPTTTTSSVIDEEKFVAYEDHPSLNEAIQRHQALNPGNKSVTLDQCFETFTRPERLDEHNKWYCANCKEHVSAMKTMQLWRLPNILVVHLKRFEFKHGLRRDKLDTLVEFPLEDLDMSKHCALYNMTSNSSFVIDDQVPAMYDLFAVTNHYGRMGFGHYTAYARQWDELGMSPEWALFDDSSVQSVGDGRGNQGKLPGVVSAAAYVLFYRRRVFS